MKKLLTVGLMLLGVNCFSMEKASFTEKEYRTYCAARELADLIFLAAKQFNEDPEYPLTINFFEDKRQNKINPYFFKTSQGICLDYYMSSIYTPWGEYHFNGSRSSDFKCGHHLKIKDMPKEKKLAAELSKLGVKMGDLENSSKYNEPFYRIIQVQNLTPPDAEIDLNKRWNITTSGDEKNKWKKMSNKYKSQTLLKSSSNKRKRYDLR
jgi:hypothetical protein